MAGIALSILLGAICLGLLTGLRTFTPIAVLAWVIHLHILSVSGTWANFLALKAVLILITILAVIELIGDKLPNTPSRLQPPGLIGRSFMGFLAGSVWLLAAGVQAWLIGALLGLVGAICGAYLGYKARTGLVRALHSADFPIALLEDAVTLGGSILVVAQAHRLF